MARPDDYRTVDVPSAGGSLRAGVWGEGRRLVVAVHGITGNHTCWWPLARALGQHEPDGEVMLAAPDLRGRGRSGGLPGPFGMAAHADDVAALLDHLGAERAVLVGHSMGGFAVCATAVRHPERISALVIVDGGAALDVPAGVPVDEVITAVIGPARARLDMTFPSREAYLDFWRVHPALAEKGAWTPDVERYLAYDLEGEPSELRSSVSLQALHADSQDMLSNPEARDAIERLPCPGVFVRATRGMLNEQTPLYPERRVVALRARWPTITDVVTLPDTNHYTVVMAQRSADELARLATAAQK